MSEGSRPRMVILISGLVRRILQSKQNYLVEKGIVWGFQAGVRMEPVLWLEI